MIDRDAAASELVSRARLFYMRGFAPGSSGNISVRLDDDRFMVTATNRCLGTLDGEDLSIVDSDGNLLEGPRPTKELPMHLSYLKMRTRARAVVHLHSPWATLYSSLADIEPGPDVVPVFTPYTVMRCGNVPLLPYYPPGDHRLADTVASIAADHAAVLLANHGLIVAGGTFSEAANIAEELEESARLACLARILELRRLTSEEVEFLRRSFPQ